MDLRIGMKRALLLALVALVSLALTAQPALAATKVFGLVVTNRSIPIGDEFEVLPASVCGVAGPFSGDLFENLLELIYWDNGHFTITLTASVRLFDGAGNQVLRDRESLHAVGASSLPQTLVIGLVSHCAPDSATPGKLYETHIALTFGADGSLVQFHGEFCDPTVYPFC